MKIAVTAMGREIDSQMDSRFGRAHYILIINQDGTLDEAIDNAQNFNAMKGAGIQAAKDLADRKVDVLITGYCGPNAFKTLEAAGIRVVVEQAGSVRETLERFQTGKVAFASQPNAEAHW